jgi:hypothetical protein
MCMSKQSNLCEFKTVVVVFECTLEYIIARSLSNAVKHEASLNAERASIKISERRKLKGEGTTYV